MIELREHIEAILLAGGMSEESSLELASTLSLHYPDHAVILLEYVPAAPEEELPPPVE